MSEQDTWRAKAEQEMLWRIREGDGGLGKFLNVGKGNRINTTKQATMLADLRMFALWRGKEWKWLEVACDTVEDYQLTVGNPINSRLQYLDAIKFERAAAHEKSRFMGIIPGGGQKA